jgi:hypothetical protein
MRNQLDEELICVDVALLLLSEPRWQPARELSVSGERVLAAGCRAGAPLGALLRGEAALLRDALVLGTLRPSPGMRDASQRASRAQS